MKLHDTITLWGLLSNELEEGDACLTRDHLAGCPECREELSLVRSVRHLAVEAAGVAPAIEWSLVDDIVAGLVEKRTARTAGLKAGWRLALFPMILAVAGALVLTARAALPSRAEAASLRAIVAAPPPAAPAVAVAPALPRVVAAKDAVRARDGAHLEEGATLGAGDSVRTAKGGRAIVKLPDASRVRVGADSQVKLTRAASDDVALTLERGRVAIQASRADRKGFEVAANGFTVRVVGTVFSVGYVKGGVEVAVAEGRVNVDRPNALPMLVDAGHRVIFSAKTQRATTIALGAENQAELADVVEAAVRVAAASHTAIDLANQPAGEWISLQPAGYPAEPQPVVAQKRASPQAEYPAYPGTPVAMAPQPLSAPAVVAPPAGPMPLAALSAGLPAPVAPTSIPDDAPLAPLVQGAAEAPSKAPPSEVQEIELPARRAKLPELSPMEIALAVSQDYAPPTRPVPAAPPAAYPVAPVQAPIAAPAAPLPGLAALPADPELLISLPAQPTPRPAPVLPMAPKATAASEGAGDTEELFLLRAERSIRRGGCQRFMLGLEELATDASASEFSQRARILRARCFEAQGRAAQSRSEYERYLRDAPNGDFAYEAEKHLKPGS